MKERPIFEDDDVVVTVNGRGISVTNKKDSRAKVWVSVGPVQGKAPGCEVPGLEITSDFGIFQPFAVKKRGQPLQSCIQICPKT